MNPLSFILTLIAVFNPHYAQVNLDDGLVAYYPFNGNANDESGNGYDGTIYGATLTEDRFGNSDSAFYFYNDYITLPHTVMNGLLNMSTSLWIKATKRNDNFDMGIISGADNLQFNEYLIAANHSKIWMVIKGVAYTSKPPNLLNNEWKNIVSTRNVEDGNVKLYVNGIFQKSSQLPSGALSIVPTGLILAQDQDCLAGCFDTGPARNFIGNIDDIRIYNRVLSNLEIQALYQTESPTTSPTELPTLRPTLSPSYTPTYNPSISPTVRPSKSLTLNTLPIVVEEIPTTYAIIGTRFELDIPSNTFYDADGDTLTLSAALGSGEVLPSWLSFYPDTWEFLGLPSIGDLGTLQIKVTASDGKDGEVSDVFFLVVTDQTESPTPSPSKGHFPNTVDDNHQNDKRHLWIILGAMIGGGCTFGVCLIAFCWYKNQEQEEKPQQKGTEMHSHQTTSRASGEVMQHYDWDSSEREKRNVTDQYIDQIASMSPLNEEEESKEDSEKGGVKTRVYKE